jgi:hypothetical protein
MGMPTGAWPACNAALLLLEIFVFLIACLGAIPGVKSLKGKDRLAEGAPVSPIFGQGINDVAIIVMAILAVSKEIFLREPIRGSILGYRFDFLGKSIVAAKTTYEACEVEGFL